KLERKATKTAGNMKFVFGEGSISERTAQHWFQKFCNGNESLEDEKGRGHPSVIDNNDLGRTIIVGSTKAQQNE
ncbi:Histone-lysine N-methyltransferase SETMAR, partial [Harpegnathos saltator]